MYDPTAALAAIDHSKTSILICLLIAMVAAFTYFLIAVRMAVRQQVYVVPLTGAALFFWHDLSFVLMYDRWFHVYNHWWVKMWWYALVGTVLLEVLMIYHVIRYGHRESCPRLSKRAFTLLVLAATLAIGALWTLVKKSINDELFFITFAITAVWSVPFHTALMVRRQSRAGQSIAMQASTIVMIVSESVAFAQVDEFFLSPHYLGFVAAFIVWPLVNIWLILNLPAQVRLPTSHGVLAHESGVQW